MDIPEFIKDCLQIKKTHPGLSVCINVTCKSECPFNNNGILNDIQGRRKCSIYMEKHYLMPYVAEHSEEFFEELL